MPKGIIIWRWDERSGPEIMGKHPITLDINQKTMMQLYSQHLNTGRSDIVSLSIGNMHLVSLWTGAVYNYFLTLILASDEVIEHYTDLVSDAMYFLLPSIIAGKFTHLIPLTFNRFVEFPKANIEQRYAHVYSNEVNRLILGILHEEGCFYKEELRLWLEEKLSTKLFNYDMILEKLTTQGFIKVASVKGLDGLFIFLLKHLFFFRAPSEDIERKLKYYDEPELIQKAKDKVIDFFKYYTPSEKDNIELADILRDEDNYKMIQYLRNSMVSNATLDKLKTHGIPNAYLIIKDLETKNVIMSLKSKKGDTIYLLKADIIVECNFPEYILNNIQSMFQNNRKSNLVLTEYLNILKENFVSVRKQRKRLLMNMGEEV